MSILSQLQWSIQQRGLTGTFTMAAKSLGRRLRPQPERPPHPFDLAHGTDTGGLISGASLSSGHPSDVFISGYAGVPPSRLLNILNRWQASNPPHPLSEYTFVDLGCGKGRAVLLASQLGFRESIGVELNPTLAATARSNAERWIAANLARSPIRIEQQDAAEFAWPSGPTLIFLFNPFSAPVLERVATSLLTHFRDRPADLELLYYKPEQAAALHAFQKIWSEPIAISPEDLAADPVADPNDLTQAYRLKTLETRTHPTV